MANGGGKGDAGGGGPQAPCTPTIRGITVQICVPKPNGNGNRIKTIQLDLDAVRAIAWCSDKDVPKLDHPKSGSGLPKRQGGPEQCPDDFVGDPDTLCWYNGKEWVCGAVE